MINYCSLTFCLRHVNKELRLYAFASDFVKVRLIIFVVLCKSGVFSLRQFKKAYHDVMKLVNTPFPFPLVQMTRTFLFIWYVLHTKRNYFKFFSLILILSHIFDHKGVFFAPSSCKWRSEIVSFDINCFLYYLWWVDMLWITNQWLN